MSVYVCMYLCVFVCVCVCVCVYEEEREIDKKVEMIVLLENIFFLEKRALKLN